jgi:hypothetical protein
MKIAEEQAAAAEAVVAETAKQMNLPRQVPLLFPFPV